ncbi:MAG: lamin tail domain-containing protein, partial [Candidatus Omnitrophica bacterium]|nr:lamin tail domain-containing protein [Candidatus Omnitrophota bacterium]
FSSLHCAYADSTVVFNEIMYHPATNEAAMEWVELYNQMAVDMDLSGWSIEGGIQYVFPEGTVLAGGGYLIVASSPDTLATNLVSTNIYGPFVGRFDNAGERLELRNNNHRLMDEVSYKDSDEWPVAADGAGVSLAKLDPNAASDLAENWTTSSRMGGTPCAPNFPAPSDSNLPAGLVSFWNFDETNGPVIDLVNGISGTLDSGVTRRTGIIGPGAVTIHSSSDACINLDPALGGAFSSADGIAVEALVMPAWNGNGRATLFRKAETTDAGLVAYWSFDEASSGLATSGDPINNNAGIFQGSATRTNGLAGLGAARFNNENSDALNVGPGVDNCFSFSNGTTVAAWIRPEWSGAGGDYDEIFRKEDGDSRILLSFQNDSNNGGAVPPVASGPVLSFGLNVAGYYSELDMPLDGADGRPTLANLEDGWAHHVAATYDAVSGLKAIYIDGARCFSTTLAGIIHSGGTAPAVIGNITPSGGEPFAGVIDEVALWSTALSSSWISALADGTPPPALGQSSTFESSQALLGFRNVRSPNSPNPSSPADEVLSFGLDVGGTYRVLDMPLDGVNGRPALAELTDGAAHHVAATYDNATGLQAIYLDGVKVCSTNLSGAVDASGKTLAVIGNSAVNGNEPFNGVVDELALWNRPLAPAEINDHFLAFKAGRSYFAPASEAAPLDLAFNEVSGSAEQPFWIEIINHGSKDAPLGGCVIARLGDSYHEYVFPEVTLAPHGLVVLDESTLGFKPESGDKLVLYPADRQAVLDAVPVKSSPRARFPEATGQWLRPSEPTPGATNRFVFHNEVVINEIMYHHRPLEAAPAQYSDITLLPVDAIWKYDQSGTDQAAYWRASGFDDRAWVEGPALLYVEDASLPAAKQTPLTLGANTYYFRAKFVFTGNTNGIVLNLHPIVDDGAVFYLNGVEVSRVNMPDGPVNYSTFANPSVADATFTGPISISADSLVAGTNVLAVEVHQASSTSSDVVFGTELLARIQVSPEVPFGF